MSDPKTTAPKPTPLQQAFHVIRDLESRVFSLTSEPIAVVGMGCRLPGSVASPEDFWRLLATGQDATSDVPAERFDVDALYDPDPRAAGKIYTRRAGLLDSIDTFDARFFGISPREAVLLDPQQRLLLEVTWEALEHAGLAPEKLEKTATGVFVAASASDYARLHLYAGDPKAIEVYDGTGNATCFAAGRLSYVLGLEGPCLAVDTACSSSLLAVHLACRSLLAGECDVAIAAGVNLIASPETFLFLSRAGNISPDGRSKAFDASADGYGRGEGCGVVVLERLSRARASDHPILAVLRGSAVNHDGTAGGLTVPNGLAQQAVIRRACANAGIEPRQLGYVEAHGTATLLGDPIEIDALGAVATGRSEGQPLWVGSVKSNIGHLETAAGIAGLMKAVLVLQHRQIPPSIHFTRPNPHVDWHNLPIRIPTELVAWEASDAGASPRLAGVSSFGLSGTNVHVVLEEAPHEPASHPSAENTDGSCAADEPLVLPLSARSPAALRDLAAAYRDRLSTDDTGASLATLAHAAARRRGHHEHRLAVTGRTPAAWIAALDAHRDDAEHAGLASGRVDPARSGKVAFVFSGQGSQWVGMGRELFATSRVFRESIQSSSDALAPHIGSTIVDTFRAGAPPPDLSRGEVVQPLLFAIQVAIARTWRSWGVEPFAVVGHSVGEVAAAHVAGALTLEDAARVIAVRGELLARIRNRGAMAVVELSESDAAARIAGYEGRVSIGAINAPRSTVLSGDAAAIDALLVELAAAGVFARRVKIDVASHGPQVEPLLTELRERLAGVVPRDGTIPMISTVTGKEVPGASLRADYWARNLRQPVLFADAIATLDRAGCGVFLEIGPHPVLGVAIRQTVDPARAVVSSLRRDQPELGALDESLAKIYARGYPVDWSAAYRSPRPHVTLPAYPWQRERYWVAPATRTGGRVDVGATTPLAGQRVLSPGDEIHFVDRLEAVEYPYLNDHRIYDDVVVPGAFHVAAVLSAARDLVGSERCVLESVVFPRALILGPDEATSVHLTASRRDRRHDDGGAGETARFRRASLASRSPRDGTWNDHATGLIAPLERSAPSTTPDDIPTAALAEVDATAFYEANTRRGIELGPAFRWIHRLWVGDREARSILDQPASSPPSASAASSKSRPPIHPAQLDAIFQTFAAAVPADTDIAYIPFSIDRLEFHGAAERPWRCAAKYQPGDDAEFLMGSAVVSGSDGAVVVRIDGLRLKRVSRAALASKARAAWSDWVFESRWERRPLAVVASRRASRSWLLFIDDSGVGEALVERLRARGDRCTTVAIGDAFGQNADSAYTVVPERLEDFTQLVAEIASAASAAGECTPTDIAFLWGIAGRDDRAIVGPGIAGLVHSMKAITGAAWRDPPRVHVVTRGAQSPHHENHQGGGAQRIDVAAAASWGMARSLFHEYPAMGFARIDIDPDTDTANALFDELVARDRDGMDDEVLLRGPFRYVGRIARGAAAAAPNATFTCSGDGSYVITGGLGGLGLRLADWLVAGGARHLVLVGRRGANSELQRRAVDAIRSRGARVEVVTADVADRAQVARALERARDIAPLRGVIHAAGVVDDGVLERQTLDRLRSVLAPKAAGAAYLDELTRGDALDFFVLFASAAGVIGAPGQSNYAAANAVLDAIALDRRARGLPALSVDWGNFSEVGLAVQGGHRGERLAHRGVRSMSPKDGIDALSALLQGNAAHVAVIALDPREWLESYPHVARSRRFSELAREAQSRAPSGRTRARDIESLRAAPAKERRDRVALLLRREVALVLRLAEADAALLDPRAPLMSLGFDSLLSLEFRNRLEGLFGSSLPAVLLWTYPTLESLTEHLATVIRPENEAASAPADAGAKSSATDGDGEPKNGGVDLDTLTEQEREALLEARLASLVRHL